MYLSRVASGTSASAYHLFHLLQSIMPNLSVQFRSPRSVLPVAIAALIAAHVPLKPATAAIDDSFQLCAAELLEAGVERQVAATACASALHPEELSACVLNIEQSTELAATDAVAACRRVRRPQELSTCVVDLNQTLENAVALEILDNCRRSLLPERYASCVSGIHGTTNYTPTESMLICISAGDRPRDLAPSFIPRLRVERETAPVQLTPLVPQTPLTPLTPIPPQ